LKATALAGLLVRELELKKQDEQARLLAQRQFAQRQIRVPFEEDPEEIFVQGRLPRLCSQAQHPLHKVW
jgi:hypothetical protein